MKTIINGKKYDTETAKAVAEWRNPCGVSDFHYYEETLYQKKTGEYFIYGEGGPGSPYATPDPTSPNCWSDGADFKPLTENEAMEWAVDHLSCDEYEALFGEVEE